MYTGRKDIVQTLFIIIFMNKDETKRVGVKYSEGQKGDTKRGKIRYSLKRHTTKGKQWLYVH